jgi:AcrR family transcriptional regulator
MVSGLSGNRSGNGVGSVDAERNVQNEEAPEGRALPFGSGFMKKRGGQGGGDCLERWDFGLAKEIARVEQAARDWGVHIDAVEGRFVGALLKAIEATGKINLAVLGDLEALFERARREGEADRRRIERMVEVGVNALAMAHQATERAGLASVRAEGAIDDAIARIAAKISGGPLSESQKWLVSKQTERNRREPSRLAAWVGAAALAGFIGGGGTMRWWSAGESATRQAVLEAVDRCRVQPRMVRAADGKTVEMCGLADLTTNRPN